MFLWICWYVNDEWACYVVAETRGRAKSLFHEYWKRTVYGEYTDVRICKIKSADGFEEAVLDTDCQELEKLGVGYLTDEETESQHGLR